VEALRFVGENNDDFWTHVRKWPGDLQDRAGGALRYLRSERARLAYPKTRARLTDPMRMPEVHRSVSRAGKSSSSRWGGRAGSGQ
jgi:hypothetical protein